MKYISLLLVLFLLSFTNIDKLSKSERKAAKAKEIRELIENRHYRFIANQALPSNGGSITLTSEYDLVVDSIRVKSFLPFYGIAYYAEYGSSDGGIKFDNNADEYSSEFNDKKEMYHIFMKVKGKKDVYQLRLDAGLSGYATLNIQSNDKQNITYNGIIEKIQ